MTINKTDIPYYTEGPAVDGNGNIFFTAPAGGIVFKMDVKGNVSEWARSAWPNGQVILANDDHLVCDSKLSVVRRFNRHGHWIREETRMHCGNQKVSTPNDLALDPEGNLYFTDSIRHEGKVWLKKISGDQQVIADRLDYPNGIAICSHRNCIYVAESYRNRVLKISMQPPHDINVFVDLPMHISGEKEKNLPDGIALDKHGNLWVAHYGMEAVYKVDPGGRLLQTIHTAMPLTSNVFVTDYGMAVITGGQAEPGPGAVISIYV